MLKTPNLNRQSLDQPLGYASLLDIDALSGILQAPPNTVEVSAAEAPVGQAPLMGIPGGTDLNFLTKTPTKKVAGKDDFVTQLAKVGEAIAPLLAGAAPSSSGGVAGGRLPPQGGISNDPNLLMKALMEQGGNRPNLGDILSGK